MILQRASPFKCMTLSQPFHPFSLTLPSPFATGSLSYTESSNMCCMWPGFHLSLSPLVATYQVSDVGIRPLQRHLFPRAGVYPGVGPIDHGDGHIFSNQVNPL